MMARAFGVAALVAIVPLAGLIGNAQTGRSDRVDFTRQIRPLLSDRCFRCHGPDPGKRKAKLRLDTREGAFRRLEDDAAWAVVKPFDPDHSELVRRTSSDDPEETMPPPEAPVTLTPAERALLKRWVAEGADYRPHWSLAPIGSVKTPAAAGAGGHPIDAFVGDRLAAAGLAPSAPAPREILIRRLAFNLTGLPPSLSEIDAFLNDRSPDAYERVVDRYLASPAYGERMAMDWLDLARYADTYGYQADVERDMSAYRDWVTRAFNENLPYDQFLTWQLAGDLLPNATRDQRIATAFNRLHRQTNEGGSIEEEFRTEYVVDRVNTFGTSMLGLTIECARCHDHKFDPITQREYYSLFAFFNNIDESGLYSHFTNATPSPSLLLWPAGKEEEHRRLLAQIADVEARLARLTKSTRDPFRTWTRSGPVARPAPIAHLAFDAVTGDTTPDSAPAERQSPAAPAARLKDGPLLVRDGETIAMKFSGDNSVTHTTLRTFGRTDRFSLVLRLEPTEPQDRAVVLHQSRAWTDAGSRGFELTLDHGRPFFGLIHFWPGNAIAVRARQSLALGAWSRLAVTYDGSSRADGIRLYLNGTRLKTDVVRDHLFKDIGYTPADNTSDAIALMLGARFRDSGFKNGLVDDVQVFDTTLTAADIVAAERREPSPADELETFLSRHYPPYVEALGELTRLRKAENLLVAQVPELMVMEEMPQPRETHLLKRGAYDAPADVVSRDTPASLPPFPKSEPRNRLGLARWLTSRTNPLAARVVVNRIWRMHFGRGLVATQEDFGNQGRLPTHPELLDWLAARFMATGWDVKALHRLIVTSSTFQQVSRAAGAAASRDPDNQLLTRGPKVRLLAEEIRDSALAASGLLNRTIGGPSVKPYQPVGLWEQSGTGKKYTQDTGDKLYRRSLYTFWRRTSPPPSMLTFDAMSREVCTAKREATSTPLQSFVLLNDPQFVEAARVLAERLMKAHPDDEFARYRDAFRTLLGRSPDDVEAGMLARLFREERDLLAAHVDDAAKLLATGESPWDRSLPRAEFAAMTMVVSAIMNEEEFVMVR